MLIIKRLEAGADHTRKYEVALDGKIIGTIANGKVGKFALDPGRHTLRMKLDYGGSKTIKFEYDGKQDVIFETQSALKGFKILLAVFYAIFLFNRGIRLEYIK